MGLVKNRCGHSGHKIKLVVSQEWVLNNSGQKFKLQVNTEIVVDWRGVKAG